MFEVKDREDKTLYIHDKILVTMSKGIEAEQIEGIVISFPAEEKVQWEPVKEGLPVISESADVLQMDSLAQRALSLRSVEDFQELIRTAQERFFKAVSGAKKKKAGTRGGKKPAPAISKEEIADLGIDLENL